MNTNYKVGEYYLDNAQMQLINTNNNAIVIAGAGSGKTLTIIGKVNYLIEKERIPPEEILLISFTNASVNDIKSKIKYNVNVFTFHKLAMYVLDKNNYTYTIASSNLFNYIIKEHLQTIDKNSQKIILKYLNLNFSYQTFLKSKYFFSFCQLISTFINLFKTNCYNYENIKNTKFSKIEKNLLLIIFNIYKKYIEEKNSTNTLDFDDLIIKATNMASETFLNFKYIIIDEFQDTSFLRLNLVKSIANYNNSKVIVVGDDWQSIYRFSGCDLNLFLNFQNYFSNVSKIILTSTYRNSQKLINIAAKFVLKNPYQINKVLNSHKHELAPLIFVPYKNARYSITTLLSYLTNISQDIMILSRNTKDIKKYFYDEEIIDNSYILFHNIKIPYYTVHKSKGLEAEYVVILNCNNETLGFPNKIENSPLIDKLFSSKEIAFAEERRLFYVAITRCKKVSYLVYDKNSPSIFIKEIKKIAKKELCNITFFQK